MEWIKVTPDTMPPDMEPVIVTVRYNSGVKRVYTEARYNQDKSIWEWKWQSGPCCNKWGDFIGTVTHWIPMPKPAED